MISNPLISLTNFGLIKTTEKNQNVMTMLSWCGTGVSVITFTIHMEHNLEALSACPPLGLWPQCKSVQVDGRCTQEFKSDPHAEQLLAVVHPLPSVPESASHSILNKTLFCLFLCQAFWLPDFQAN